VAVVGVANALVVLAGVRLLALVRPVGILLVVELLRALLISGVAALAAWLVLRTRAADGSRALLFNPGPGRCVVAGLLAGLLVGAPAMAVAAIPDPTDSPDLRGEVVLILGFVGLPLGLVLGIVFGLVFLGHATLALRRELDDDDEAFESAVRVASGFVGGAGAMSALLHALVGKLDVLGVAMLVLAAVGFAIVAKRVGSASSGVVSLLLVLVMAGSVVLYLVKDASAPSWDSTPEPIARGKMTHLAAVESAMCAMRSSDGRLVCWGSRAGALLGERSVAYRTPQPHPKLGRIRAFAIADDRACAVLEAGDHRASCWTVKDAEPRPIGPPEVVEIGVGDSFAVAVTADGAVWRWGDDPAGVSRVATPELVPGLPAIAQVSAGNAHVVAFDRAGNAYCWGRGSECGVGGDRVPVTRLDEGRLVHYGAGWRVRGSFGMSGSLHEDNIRQYAASGTEACVLHGNGAVGCTRGDKASPNSVLGRGVLEIAGSKDGYCALTSGETWCWNGYSLLFSIFQ
jgi:Regulator of chromosome condensation (RCC1) repeat